MDISIDNVSAQYITEARDWLLAALAEKYPDIHFTSGALFGFVVAPQAIVLAALRQYIETLGDSGSLANILGSSDFDTEAIADLLANFGVNCDTSGYATGNLLVTLSEPHDLTLDIGTQFTSYNGITFNSTETVTVSSEGETGYVQFEVPVQCTEIGAAGNVLQGTTFTCSTTISDLVSIVAASDFTGGSDTEAILEAVERISMAKNSTAFGSSDQIYNLIQYGLVNDDETDLANITDVSAVGANDEEMTRDQRSLFPISLGGKIDIYLKCVNPSTKSITKTASLIGINDEGYGIWRIDLTRQESEGVYKPLYVYESGTLTNPFSIYQIARSFSLVTDDYEFIPDIQAASEAVFSCFQTTSFTFIDTKTAVELEDIGTLEKDYDVILQYVPQVSAVQTYLESKRAPYLDYLVRACVPAYLQVSVNLFRSISADDIESIKQAIVEYIRGLQIGETIYCSRLSSAIEDVLPTNTTVNLIELSADILGIDDTITSISNAGLLYLAVPTDLTKGISSKTVGWFITEDNIEVS